jgi:benzodiazapine receptor
MKIIINWILFILVITTNALANILPINGYNTGQISGFYPNYFVPAGFTFSIWGIIYLFLLNYSISYTYFTIKQGQFPDIKKYLDAITPYYWFTCILNAGWILAWHYLQVAVSVLIILAFLVSLIKIFMIMQKEALTIKPLYQFLIKTPFSIYLGWISVATIANITALLVHVKWSGFGIDPIYWTILMISIAIVLGIYFIVFFKNIAHPLVLVWALWGIKAAQGPKSELINQLTVIGILVLVSLIVRVAIRKIIAR